MALVATEESDVIDAVKEELWEATLIPDAEPEPVVPPCDSDAAVKVRPLPVDVGFIMHVTVREAPADRLSIVAQLVTTENHEVPLERVVTMLLSVLDPEGLVTVAVTVACSFSVRDLDTSTETVNAAKTELTVRRKDTTSEKSKTCDLIRSPRTLFVCSTC